MQEEIFGPLLPIEAYATLDEAIATVNAAAAPARVLPVRRRPRGARALLLETIAGGVTVNDTLWHFAHEELPFGGVGASGIGAYHGEAGFRTFSHQKSVFVQPRFAAAKLLYPPYGARSRRCWRCSSACDRARPTGPASVRVHPAGVSSRIGGFGRSSRPPPGVLRCDSRRRCLPPASWPPFLAMRR